MLFRELRSVPPWKLRYQTFTTAVKTPNLNIARGFSSRFVFAVLPEAIQASVKSVRLANQYESFDSPRFAESAFFSLRISRLSVSAGSCSLKAQMFTKVPSIAALPVEPAPLNSAYQPIGRQKLV